jgi:hypothetical protein
MPLFSVHNPSRQDLQAVIQFLDAEGCQPAAIVQEIRAVCRNACVLKTAVVNCIGSSVCGGGERVMRRDKARSTFLQYLGMLQKWRKLFCIITHHSICR